jgi:hypothetical protein
MNLLMAHKEELFSENLIELEKEIRGEVGVGQNGKGLIIRAQKQKTETLQNQPRGSNVMMEIKTEF